MLLAQRLSQQGPVGKMLLWSGGKEAGGGLHTLHYTVKVCHLLCHCVLLMALSQYQELLSADVFLSDTPGCASC